MKLYVFRAASALFACAAIYHGIGWMDPSLIHPKPQWVHLFFVVLDIGIVFLFWYAPPWLVFPFGVLTLQQIYSHGTRAWSWWHDQGLVDWASLGIICGLPIALVFLIQHYREHKCTAKPPM